MYNQVYAYSAAAERAGRVDRPRLFRASIDIFCPNSEVMNSVCLAADFTPADGSSKFQIPPALLAAGDLRRSPPPSALHTHLLVAAIAPLALIYDIQSVGQDAVIVDFVGIFLSVVLFSIGSLPLIPAPPCGIFWPDISGSW